MEVFKVTEGLPEPGQKVQMYSTTFGWLMGWRNLHGDWIIQYNEGFALLDVTHWAYQLPIPTQ